MSLKQNPALIEWLAGGSRGCSSNAIVQCLTGLPAARDESGCDHPHDPDDLDRCLLLLDAVPALRPLLPRMALISPEWAALVKHWPEIEQSHLDEVGLGWKKARKAPKTYALMRRVLEAVRSAA